MEESSQEDDITEVQFPRISDRLALGLSKPEEVFNFWLTGRPQTGKGFQLLGDQRATPACYSSTTLRQQQRHRIHHTLRLAVQVIRCACEGLLSQVSTS